MKKSIFKILFVVAVLVGISIPNNVAAQQNVVDNDSLSIILGVSMGGNVANRIQEMPDSLPFKAKLSKDDIIKGFEYVLSIDTANVGISAGVSMGVQLADQIAQLEQMGAKIDRKKVIEEFSKALKQDSVSMEDLNKYQLFINISGGKLQAEAQRKYMEELEKNTGKSVEKIFDGLTKDKEGKLIPSILVEEAEENRARYTQQSIQSGGSGETMTLKDIFAIKDAGERQRAMADNAHLFVKGE